MGTFRFVTALGFLLMLALMALLGANGVMQLRGIQSAIERVVETQNEKIRISTDMQVAGYRRTDALYHMLLLSDAFARDPYFLEYQAAGFAVGKARVALRALPLDEAERAILERQDGLIAKVVELQERVVDLIAADRVAEAHALTLAEALPLQAAINSTFQEIRDIQALDAYDALDQARVSGRDTLLLTGVLGLVGLIVGLVVAVTVYRRVARQERTIGRQMNDLREARDAADRANRAKSEFLATMSHEIRTPMNGVLGMAELLQGTPLNEQQRAYLETISSSGETLVALLNDLLDLSKIEAGRLELEDTDFDPRRLIDGVLLLMSARATAKGLSLSADVPDEIPVTLRGDPARLRQVLLNLVSNAVKFTERGGVRVRVRQEAAGPGGAALTLEVSDTGIGIDPAGAARLFDPYTQADSSVTRRFGGTGLGLNICKRLVEAMGGAIGVDSVPRRGSTFFFDLPLRPGAPAVVGEEAAESRLPSLRILVADDDPVNRQVAEGMLTRLGHRCRCVADGAQAVEALVAGEFDLVLLDMQMPVMDGIEAARTIRALEDPRKASTPLVALTASMVGGDLDRCRAAGVDGVLVKPVRAARLQEELARCWRPDDRPAVADIALAFGPEGPLVDLEAVGQLVEAVGSDGMEGLLRLFRESSRQVLEGLSLAWETRDYDTLALKAHRLRGASLSLGLAVLGQQAGALEAAARGHREEPMRDLLGRIGLLTEQSVAELELLLGDTDLIGGEGTDSAVA